MADTALTMITDALLDLGVLSDGETPLASQSQGALRQLNYLIDSWNTEGLIHASQTSYVVPLASGKQIYTMGPSGDINIPIQSTVTNLFVRDTLQPAAYQYDMPIHMATDEEWQSVGFKGMTSNYPFYTAWVNYAAPLAQIYVNPVPTSSQYALVVWTDGLISNYTMNSLLTLPPGLWRALQKNLAMELAPSYGIEPSQMLVKSANDALSAYKINNVQLNEMQIDPCLSGNVHYNFLTNRSR